MHKIATAVRVLVATCMAFAPLSASACDLSCWLRPASSDCHAAGLSTGSSQTMMSASSAMDMSAEGEMSFHHLQADAAADDNVSAARYHSMTTPMDMVRRSLEVIREPDLISRSGFDYSRKLSRCVHEICNQISASPPKTRADHPAYFPALAPDGLRAANFASNAFRRAAGPPEPITPAVELFTTLRI